MLSLKKKMAKAKIGGKSIIMELDVALMLLKDWRERVNQMDIAKIIERSRRKAGPPNG